MLSGEQRKALLRGEVGLAPSGGWISDHTKMKVDVDVLAERLKEAFSLDSKTVSSALPGIIAEPYSDHIQIVADSAKITRSESSEELVFEIKWLDMNSVKYEGQNFSIPLEVLGTAESRDGLVAIALEDAKAAGMPHKAAETLWELWKGGVVTDGISAASASGSHGTAKFPETAAPVLARLEAEVEMCEDPLQKSRLKAIFEALQRLAPVERDDELSSEA